MPEKVSGDIGNQIQFIREFRVTKKAKEILAQSDKQNTSVFSAVEEAAKNSVPSNNQLLKNHLGNAIKIANTMEYQDKSLNLEDFTKKIKEKEEEKPTPSNPNITTFSDSDIQILFNKISEIHATATKINQPIDEAKITIKDVKEELERQKNALTAINEDITKTTNESKKNEMESAKKEIEEHIEKLEKISTKTIPKNPCTDDAKKTLKEIKEGAATLKTLQQSRIKPVTKYITKEIKEGAATLKTLQQSRIKPVIKDITLDTTALATTGKNYDESTKSILDTLTEQTEKINKLLTQAKEIEAKMVDKQTTKLYKNDYDNLVGQLNTQARKTAKSLHTTTNTLRTVEQNIKDEEELVAWREYFRNLQKIINNSNSHLKLDGKLEENVPKKLLYEDASTTQLQRGTFGYLYSYEQKTSKWSGITSWEKTGPLQHKGMRLQPTPEELEAVALKLGAKKTKDTDKEVTYDFGSNKQKAIELLYELQCKRLGKSAVADGVPKNDANKPPVEPKTTETLYKGT